MLAIFIGLTAANLITLGIVFSIGLLVDDGAGSVTGWHAIHITLGIGAGLVTLLCHLTCYTYFMATTKWLREATAKGGLDVNQFLAPALKNKSRCFPAAMLPVIAVMLAMFAGAGADPLIDPWWASEVHLGIAALAIGVNLIAAIAEAKLILSQRRLMDQTLECLNAMPDITVARV